jgi:hypothetical protein
MWCGSSSHIAKGGDLDFLIPLIEKTVDEYQWIFQGVIPEDLIKYVQQGKIEFYKWIPVTAMANVHYYKIRPDICIAPLKPSRFNSCKSDLKYLETCALGRPCITTSFLENGLRSPYDVADAEICLPPDADIWKTTIDLLKNDSNYYMEVVKEQYKFLSARWLENNIEKWTEILK